MVKRKIAEASSFLVFHIRLCPRSIFIRIAPSKRKKIYHSMYCRYKQRLEEIQKIRMTKLKLVLFVGSAREGRLADRVLKFVRSTIDQDHELIVHGLY